MRAEWIEMYFPEDGDRKDREVQQLSDTFKMLFRDEEGKPKEISLSFDNELSEDVQVQDFLKTIETKDK